MDNYRMPWGLLVNLGVVAVGTRTWTKTGAAVVHVRLKWRGSLEGVTGI